MTFHFLTNFACGYLDCSCQASLIKDDLLVFIFPNDSGLAPRLSFKTASWVNVLWVSNPIKVMLSLFMSASPLVV